MGKKIIKSDKIVKKTTSLLLTGVLYASAFSTVISLGAGIANTVQNSNFSQKIDDYKIEIKNSDDYHMHKYNAEVSCWKRYRSGDISLEELKSELKEIEELSNESVLNYYLNCLNPYSQADFKASVSQIEETKKEGFKDYLLSATSTAAMVMTSYLLDKQQKKEENEDELVG